MRRNFSSKKTPDRVTGAWMVLMVLGLTTTQMTLPAKAEQFNAKVVSVVDGDTMTVLHDNKRERLIMYGIDCPELTQDFGPQAKEFTDQCCYNKIVNIDVKGKDKLGRIVGDITLSDGADLNKELVKRGFAWWSDKFAPNDLALKELHEKAQADKVGLWASPNPIPPWIFRNGEKGVQAKVISH